MQQPTNKRARANTKLSVACDTLIFETSDNQRFPTDVSAGGHTATHYPMLSGSDRIIHINLPAADFRPLHLALAMLNPNYTTPNLVVCAALAASDHPVSGWPKRCIPVAKALGIEKIAGVLGKWVEQCNSWTVTSFRRVGQMDTWRCDMARDPAPDFPPQLISILGGRARKTVEIVMPRLGDRITTVPTGDQAKEKRNKAYSEWAAALPRPGEGTRLEQSTQAWMSMFALWRPFLDATRGINIIPGAYRQAREYADSVKHPDADTALRGPLAAMARLHFVELDNPFHLFVAASGCYGWWTGHGRDMLWEAFEDNLEVFSLVLDGEARLTAELPRKCDRTNSVCIEAIMASILSVHPEIADTNHDTRVIADAIAKDYFGPTWGMLGVDY